jgi:hypothetical protein
MQTKTEKKLNKTSMQIGIKIHEEKNLDYEDKHNKGYLGRIVNMEG